VKLSKCAAFQEGYVNPSQSVAHYFGNEIKWLRAVDLNNGFVHDTSRRLTKAGFDSAGKAALLFEPGTLAISKSGTIGRLGILTDYMCGNRAVINVKPLKSICDTRFLFYAMQYHHADIVRLADGSVQKNLYISQLGGVELSLPPLPEQQAIACILGALDDKIELNRRRNKTLEAMARAIFQSWFVDFDPVHAKAAGRQPPGLAPQLAALFPNSFEDSELGPIPKGWRVGTVADVAEINAWTLNRDDEIKEIAYIEISEVLRGEIGNIARHERGSEPSRARRRLRHGDTVVSTVRPDRGSYFLCIDPPPSLIASTGFAVLTPRSGRWAFLHQLTTRTAFGEELGRLADGGAYPAVRPEVITSQPIVMPSEEKVYASFEESVQSLLLKCEAGRRESRALAVLRDTLLPKLISGELRVPDAERIVSWAV
jgi:type I restriction enzyme S subunit